MVLSSTYHLVNKETTTVLHYTTKANMCFFTIQFQILFRGCCNNNLHLKMAVGNLIYPNCVLSGVGLGLL